MKGVPVERRAFLRNCALGLTGAALATQRRARASTDEPLVVSTWSFGAAANDGALRVLSQGGSALDAAVAGVQVAEADPENTSVGYGGYPNREGVVELDAAVMDGATLQAGSVAGLRGIKHPVAVARRVMLDTPHVLLVGEGARRFALRSGFKKESLLTPASRRAWKQWKSRGVPVEDHDTIGMVVRSADGTMAAACSTSGLAWKLAGRVGDSPLIGHGLYCDQKAGGAVATGVGEEVIKIAGTYQVVEFMRQGIEPDEAVRRVVRRVLDRAPDNAGKLVAFLALRADGEIGYGSTMPGFQAAVRRGANSELLDAPSFAPGG
ncbi:MAG: N(4)-(beta-N-acetylglucosaminyl)-L-asparaginase [bacterium]|nr:N(4)-(beta-N-acetylglucosaminyl)-L-asparaginase [bacterium]